MRRPVLVVTRAEAVHVLTSIVVAPITLTVRGIPSEVLLGPEDGLPHECAATLDNLLSIRWREMLSSRLTTLSGERRSDLCRALNAMSGC